MKLPASLAPALLLLPALCSAPASSQRVHAPAAEVDYRAAGSPLAPAPADPRFVAALHQVSPRRIQANISRLVDFNNRVTVSSTETDLKPGTGVLAAADWIKAQFDEYGKACGGCLEVTEPEFIESPEPGGRSRFARPTPLRDVVAILRGTDPVARKRMYLVTGHYDTRETDVMNTHDPAPGANDDSSGTAVSMEAARILSQYKFPATLVFVCVAGEEQGLNGSRELAQLAKKEGWQLEGVLNNDIVGGDTTPGDALQSKSLIRVFSQGILPTAPIEQIRAALSIGGENETPSRMLAREVLEVSRTYFAAPGAQEGERSTVALKTHFTPVMELRLDRYLRGGDHKSFSDEGFPAVRFTEWRENFDHQHQHVRVENGKEYGDLLKFDDFSYIANTARLNMATLATLASSPGMPRNVVLVTSNLDNNTTIKWDAPLAPGSVPGSELRYQIVWRETAASDWQYGTDASKFTGPHPATGAQDDPYSAFVATVPISKDNVFFGVRACDGAGHCSQAVAPLPEVRRNR